ncbi:unnamed protein product [Phytophthora fragariaefolia]|uniref:Unnamed protein product n=1 Tax=Phytophthora fragariaefolia TaxID=1490495 RepID=A0A9W6X4G1_9STRA|nr:unnamed protein product [Phytophthora fragariaefolia]
MAKQATADNVRPGGPTTMDVLMGWITKPGNVKRWRSEARAPLIREIVELMQREGLTHRKAPFVRYKVDAIEKQYITAKQWLLETGLHDAFVRGKATPEVRAHVDHVCPSFRRLDPAFRGVPFSHKRAETIELDADSAEESKQEIRVPDSDADGNESRSSSSSDNDSDSDSDGPESEEVYDGEEEPEPAKSKKPATLSKFSALMHSAAEREQTPEPLKKAGASRERKAKEVELEKPAPAEQKKKKKKKKLATSDRLPVAAEKPVKSAEPQKKKAAKKGKTVESAEPQREKKAAKDEKKAAKKGKHAKSAEPQEKKTAKQENKTVKDRAEASTPVADSEQDASVKPNPEAESTPAPFKKKRGRPPKSATASPVAENGLVAAQKAIVKTASATKRKVGEEEVSAVESKRAHNQEESTVKRARTREHDETERKAMVKIEREALLKRVEDEQKQRHDVYELERAKLRCELEATHVQLLFEKATARKKLDQLGVSQQEIDRLLPL